MSKYRIKIKHPILAVPLSYFDKHNSEQFQLIWLAAGCTRCNCPKDILNNVLHYVLNKFDRGGAMYNK